ncbi:unnamed protein product [Diatraea saccharalis]|uniref:beta-N-acetylhexosaminidase n=1 Tax=Diatraea saccharalis TaxID=40085 RepID=A0A9N9RE10_9NEOP|nr:unnamed protein product [Diatraea saccharalis]
MLSNKSVRLENVVVHIDLKGTPLKLSYLESLFPLMKKHGVNSLLMEYEDMFPYEGKLVNMSAEYCYSKVELKNFLRAAQKSGFEIIPLIQTFGHLENALKLAEFQHLREVPSYPDSICPSNIESLVFLRDLIKQIIDFHKEVAPLKFLHIGCDEVFHINQCQLCKERSEIITNRDLLVQHVRAIYEVVNSLSAKTAVLIWDDMLRDIKAYEWLNIESFNNIHVVYWDYGSPLRVTHQNLYRYHKKFEHIWIASAYKGADGRTATITDVSKRFRNHFDWMHYIIGYRFGGEDVYNFKGIILTGWSRYSHMDPPCELLPVSIPSLVLNLLVIQNFKSGISYSKINHERDIIQNMFRKHINIELNESFKCLIDYDHLDFSVCKFEGHELYNLMKQYIMINSEVAFKFISEEYAFASVEYYSNMNTINMNNVIEMKVQLVTMLDEIINIENRLATEIVKYYHHNFVREYIDYKSYPNKKRIMQLLNIINNYMEVRTWRKRTVSNSENVTIQPN